MLFLIDKHTRICKRLYGYDGSFAVEGQPPIYCPYIAFAEAVV